MQQRHFDNFLDPLLLTIALLQSESSLRGEPRRPINMIFFWNSSTAVKIRDFCNNMFDITK